VQHCEITDRNQACLSAQYIQAALALKLQCDGSCDYVIREGFEPSQS
jgi:hypothetical protein